MALFFSAAVFYIVENYPISFMTLGERHMLYSFKQIQLYFVCPAGAFLIVLGGNALSTLSGSCCSVKTAKTK